MTPVCLRGPVFQAETGTWFLPPRTTAIKVFDVSCKRTTGQVQRKLAEMRSFSTSEGRKYTYLRLLLALASCQAYLGRERTHAEHIFFPEACSGVREIRLHPPTDSTATWISHPPSLSPAHDELLIVLTVRFTKLAIVRNISSRMSSSWSWIAS